MYWRILFVRKDCFWIQDKVFCTLQTMDRKKMSLEDLKNTNYHEGDTVSVTYQHGWIGWDVVADIKK